MQDILDYSTSNSEKYNRQEKVKSILNNIFMFVCENHCTCCMRHLRARHSLKDPLAFNNGMDGQKTEGAHPSSAAICLLYLQDCDCLCPYLYETSNYAPPFHFFTFADSSCDSQNIWCKGVKNSRLQAKR